MTWVEDQINKEDIFPTTPGERKRRIFTWKPPLKRELQGGLSNSVQRDYVQDTR